MNNDQIPAEFFNSIKQHLIDAVKKELRPLIAVELDQRRLTVAEASTYTGMSDDTIYALCREKKIPHYKAGSENSRKPKILFRVESLDKWMRQQEKANCEGWQ